MKRYDETELTLLRQNAQLMMMAARQAGEMELSWLEAVEQISLMHTMQPLLDPTSYRDAMYNGTIDNIDGWAKIFRAAADFLKVIDEVVPEPAIPASSNSNSN
ncbi:MAG: hypothetical protein IIA73_06010 [Proteobacteria bacterium]|nr:hypothetical protein [Pseudomonadota bacterium]